MLRGSLVFWKLSQADGVEAICLTFLGRPWRDRRREPPLRGGGGSAVGHHPSSTPLPVRLKIRAERELGHDRATPERGHDRDLGRRI